MFASHTHPLRLEFAPLCGLALILCSSGCGERDTVKLLPVEGTVMLSDKVLVTDAKTKGTVRLYPDKTKGNDSLQIPRGAIDSEGKFKILTGTKPGVTPGWYIVTVDAATVIDPKNPYLSAAGFLMPERYIDKNESGLAFEVVENAPPGAYDLKLSGK
jgi:hypothetical protein